jgi:hypothetical protein
MSAQKQIKHTIAEAIKKADSSYFFEDYTKQAQAVLRAIEASGFAVVPKEMPDDLAKLVADNMRTGRIKPEEHVKSILALAFEALKKA